MKRIYLRAFEPDDYLLISKWRNDPETSSLLVGNHYYVSQEREKKWVIDKSTMDSKSVYLAVCLKENDQMIGYVSLVNFDLRNQKVDIGGWIIGDKTLWNQGYAKEAVITLLNYLFAEYPVHKCQSYCLDEHIVSNKIHKSVGFNLDGILRDDVFKHGEFKSVMMYSMLRDEYVAKYGKPDGK